MEEAQEKKEATQRRDKIRMTVRHPRQPMSMHQDVRLQDRDPKLWSIKGKIVAIRPSGKSYIVRTKAGTYLRGMRFIKADHTGCE